MLDMIGQLCTLLPARRHSRPKTTLFYPSQKTLSAIKSTPFTFSEVRKPWPKTCCSPLVIGHELSSFISSLWPMMGGAMSSPLTWLSILGSFIDLKTFPEPT